MDVGHISVVSDQISIEIIGLALHRCVSSSFSKHYENKKITAFQREMRKLLEIYETNGLIFLSCLCFSTIKKTWVVSV